MEAVGARQRVIDGMLDAVARRGYTEASIAQAIASAHVSRSTFYEHFTGKEDCFLAGYEELGRRMTEELSRSAERAGWAEKADAILGAVLDPEERSAPRWRLLLTLARGGGPAVRLARERLVAEIEELFDATLAGAPAGGLTLDVPSKALLGGVRSVLSVRRYEGAADGGERGQLARWARSYAVRAGPRPPRHSPADWARLGSALCPAGAATRVPREPRSLPRGRARLPAETVSREHQLRILAATAAVMCEQGYAASRVADIVRSAHVSRDVFYTHFHGKQEAFIATQRFALGQATSACSRAFFSGGQWPERVWSGLRALLEQAAANPELTHLVLIEPSAAMGAARQQMIDSLRGFTVFLEEGYRQSERAGGLPRLCSDAIAGAIYELMYHHAVTGRTARMVELTPQCAYVALAPFMGPEQAIRFVELEAAQAGARER
jgi:AcrR family transcriptional regulator